MPKRNQERKRESKRRSSGEREKETGRCLKSIVDVATTLRLQHRQHQNRFSDSSLHRHFDSGSSNQQVGRRPVIPIVVLVPTIETLGQALMASAQLWRLPWRRFCTSDRLGVQSYEWSS
ncbi:hypothetical protein L6452_40461 [Arctium lappa]|uniref:Uncharacterized protein n=1 Tax=Arctium lappa TaxID=4217 RepID=A0ACB8XN67_ARCLA|nr:hypothetical protein L6452_40461 [Arctium lappa]